jgi:hypothetical protein
MGQKEYVRVKPEGGVQTFSVIESDAGRSDADAGEVRRRNRNFGLASSYRAR